MNTKARAALTPVILSIMLLWILLAPNAALAAGQAGQLDSANARFISGWACDYANINEAVTVELEIVSQETSEVVRNFTVSANQKRGDFTDNLGQIGHGFQCEVSWSDFEDGYYIIQAYLLSNGQRVKISEDSHSTVLSSDFQRGPGIADKQIVLSAASSAGKPLGTFQTTGYCNCSICSPGNSRTYSGTVPQANHTVSADLNVFPIGSKLLINGVIYTVEDKGSNVIGNKIDIYYDEHSKALAHGLKSAEVYLIE